MNKSLADCYNILIVDDDINLRYTLSLILQKAGYLVTTTGRAKEAMHYLQSTHYHLTVLDCPIPDSSGTDLLSKIVGMRPPPSVLIVTSAPSAELNMEARRLGVKAIIAKPVSPEKLLERIHEILKPLNRANKLVYEN